MVVHYERGADIQGPQLAILMALIYRQISAD